MSSLDNVLQERGERYGSFKAHAALSQRLKDIVFNGNTYTPSQTEALEMICHKIARICNGDPNYVDSWIDIAGYAQLVADELIADTTV